MHILILLFLLSTSAFAQCDSVFNKQEEELYCLWGVQMPELIGGIDSLQSKLVYPKAALKNKIEGRVYVLIFIDTLGNVNCPEIVSGKGLGNGCDEEAIRIVSSLRFRPGIFHDKRINVQMVVPVVFNLPIK